MSHHRLAAGLPFPAHALLIRTLRVIAVLTLLVVAGGAGAAPARAATDYYPISGSGSTWSFNALDSWRGDIRSQGVTVNFAPNGSSTGRSQFLQGLTDFGVSEIPFQTHPTDGSYPENPSLRPSAYMPIVAGGTSFMYNLNVGGRTIRDMRLSGDSISKIFTRQITKWSDPQITREYGSQLPPIDIRPVVRSDGSGTTAQFTLWMDRQYPAIWRSFYKPGGLTSQYPSADGIIAQNGSTGQAGFVASPTQGNGAIAYLEYSYANSAAGGPFPVVQLLNRAGYYVEPTQYNVAVALTQARINPDLTQILDGVYNNTDPRSYPLSSYSYMILPTTVSGSFTTDKGRTLSVFSNYFLCQGQQKAGPLGYSPLPLNLVQAAFKQVRRIPGYVPNPTELSGCNNPTFDGRNPNRNVLAVIAPQPNPCQAQNQPRCGSGQTATAPKPGGIQPPAPPVQSTSAPGGGGTATAPGGSSTAPGGGSGGTPGGGTGAGSTNGGTNGTGGASGTGGATVNRGTVGGTGTTGTTSTGTRAGGTGGSTTTAGTTGTAPGTTANGGTGPGGTGNVPGGSAPRTTGTTGTAATAGTAGTTPGGRPTDEANGTAVQTLPNGQTVSAGNPIAAVPVTLADQRENGALTPLLAGLATVELLLAAALPPVVVGLLRRRRANRDS